MLTIFGNLVREALFFLAILVLLVFLPLFFLLDGDLSKMFGKTSRLPFSIAVDKFRRFLYFLVAWVSPNGKVSRRSTLSPQSGEIPSPELFLLYLEIYFFVGECSNVLSLGLS